MISLLFRFIVHFVRDQCTCRRIVVVFVKTKRLTRKEQRKYTLISGILCVRPTLSSSFVINEVFISGWGESIENRLSLLACYFFSFVLLQFFFRFLFFFLFPFIVIFNCVYLFARAWSVSAWCSRVEQSFIWLSL